MHCSLWKKDWKCMCVNWPVFARMRQHWLMTTKTIEIENEARFSSCCCFFPPKWIPLAFVIKIDERLETCQLCPFTGHLVLCVTAIQRYKFIVVQFYTISLFVFCYLLLSLFLCLYSYIAYFFTLIDSFTLILQLNRACTDS